MTVFFTADTHFGHGGALGLYRRPFGSVREMDAAIVERWNHTVGPDDEVWHLGNFAVRRPVAEVSGILVGLNGRIHLIVGNNDGPATTSMPDFASVQHYAELTIEKVRLVLCHYPFRSWNGMSKGAMNLHGHSHGRLKPVPRQINVGVYVWDFQPVSLDQLLAMRGGRRARGTQ